MLRQLVINAIVGGFIGAVGATCALHGMFYMGIGVILAWIVGMANSMIHPSVVNGVTTWPSSSRPTTISITPTSSPSVTGHSVILRK